MKATLLTIALMVVTVVTSLGQGTINPLNGTLTRIKKDSNCNGVYDATDADVTAADGLQFAVLWGAAGTAPTHAVPGFMTCGNTSGILVGLPAILALEGAGDVGTVVSLQIIASAPGGLRTQTEVKQVTLAPSAGPGTVIWSSTGTASRFSPLLFPCPEPSTIALGLLGFGSLLLFRRRR
jgi:hypothetical protein